MRYILSVSVFILGLLMLPGCETMRYFSHAAIGQLDMELKKESVAQLMEDPETLDNLKRRLKLVAELKQFAKEKTLLPLSDEFSTYVAIEREHVLWSLFVTPAYELRPQPWCYPIAGCISYRSYFDHEYAIERSYFYQQQGLDVFIAPAAAYSTLGWFSDPLLNTYIYSSDDRLASIIFHELGHQLYYIPSDVLFNEAFASFVERFYVMKWLQFSNRKELMTSFVEGENRHTSMLRLMSAVREKLQRVYQLDISDAEKKIKKAEIIRLFEVDYNDWKTRWEDYSGYDFWLSGGVNNAKLATVSTYYRWIPVFDFILQQHNCNFIHFMEEIEQLSNLSLDDRKAKFENILAQLPSDQAFNAQQYSCQ